MKLLDLAQPYIASSEAIRGLHILNTHMKTLKKIGLILLSLIILGIGTSIGYGIHMKQDSSLVGTAQSKLPPVGSVVRVESVFDDGTFIGTFKSVRRYYQNPTIKSGTKIVLESGQPYEVVLQKENQIMLVPIR